MDNTDTQLPANWITKKSRSRGDKIYYLNTATGESVWKFPVHENAMDKNKGRIKLKSGDGINANSRAIKKVQKTPAQHRLERLQTQLKTDDQHDKLIGRRSTNYVKSNVGLPNSRIKPYTFTIPSKSTVEDKNKLIYSSTSHKNIVKQLQSVEKSETPSRQKAINDRLAISETPQKFCDSQKMPTSAPNKTSAQSRLNQLQRSLSTELRKASPASSYDSANQFKFKNNGSIWSPGGVTTNFSRKFNHSFDRDDSRLSKLGHESKVIYKDPLTKKSVTASKRLKDLQHNIIAKSHREDNDAILFVNKSKPNGTIFKQRTETISPKQCPIVEGSTKKSIFSTLTNLAKKFFGTVTGDRSKSIQGDTEDDIDMDTMKAKPGVTSSIAAEQDDGNDMDIEMEWEPTPESDISEIITKMRSGPNDSPNSFDIVYAPMVIESDTLSNKTIVVADTNIFMNTLLCIKDILARVDRVEILVPYMVLQELDKLKSQHGQKNVSAMARQAIRFIRDTFTEGNAKFQGQGAVDHNRHLIEIENPDDKILNCCLQVRSYSRHCILLSNDFNLTNKAIASGIGGCSTKQIKERLNALGAL